MPKILNHYYGIKKFRKRDNLAREQNSFDHEWIDEIELTFEKQGRWDTEL